MRHSAIKRFAIEKYTILQLILRLFKLVSIFTIILLARQVRFRISEKKFKS